MRAPLSTMQSCTVLPGNGHVVPDADEDDGDGISVQTGTEMANRWPESQVSDGRGGGRKVSIAHEPIRQTKRQRTSGAMLNDGSVRTRRGDAVGTRATLTGGAPSSIPAIPKPAARAHGGGAAKNKAAYGRLTLQAAA